MTPDSNEHDLTLLLQAAKGGDGGARDELFSRIYDDLHQRAQRIFSDQRAGHTLQPTAVVHEAWMKLCKGEELANDREHFFAVAVTAMRQIIIDHARARQAAKRGGGLRPVTLDSEQVISLDEDVLSLDDSLEKLSKLNERHAKVVELRVFGGLSIDETAAVLGVTHSTIESDWSMARAWLRMHMESD